MATVTLPGLGEVEQSYVVAAGAGIALFAAVAYYRSGQQTELPEGAVVISSNDAMPATDYENPSPGGSSPVVVDDDSGRPPVPRTNPEWTQRATDYLTNLGWDPSIVATALGRYLTRQTLTGQQQEIVRSAVGAWGQPPEGGPWPIDAPVTAPETPKALPAPGGLRKVTCTRTSIHFRWNKVEGATGYQINETSVRGRSEHHKGATQLDCVIHGLSADLDHNVTVRAKGPAGLGAPASLTIRTAR